MLPTHRAPTHPGAMLLEEFIKPAGMTQKEFAASLNWTYAKLNEIVHAKRGITSETALALSDALTIEPEFWLNLQRDWDLWHAKRKHKKVPVLKFPSLSTTLKNF